MKRISERLSTFLAFCRGLHNRFKIALPASAGALPENLANSVPAGNRALRVRFYATTFSSLVFTIGSLYFAFPNIYLMVLLWGLLTIGWFYVWQSQSLNLRQNISLTLAIIIGTISGIEIAKFGAVSLGMTSQYNRELLLAISNGETSKVKMLMAAGADAKVSKQLKEANAQIIRQALENAVSNGDVEIVKELLASYASVNPYSAISLVSGSLYKLAIRKGELEIIKALLLTGGNSYQAEGSNLLDFAIRYGDREVVKLLFDLGVDLHRSQNNDAYLLQFAAERGDIEIFKILLSRIDFKNIPEYSLADILKRLKSKDADEIVKLLLSTNPDTMSKPSVAPAYAIERGNTELVKRLLASGVDFKGGYGTDQTYLMHAAEKGHGEIVKLLIAAGAPLNPGDLDGDTALALAEKNGHKQTEEVLRAAGAHLEPTDWWPKQGYRSAQDWWQQFRLQQHRFEASIPSAVKTSLAQDSPDFLIVAKLNFQYGYDDGREEISLDPSVLQGDFNADREKDYVLVGVQRSHPLAIALASPEAVADSQLRAFYCTLNNLNSDKATGIVKVGLSSGNGFQWFSYAGRGARNHGTEYLTWEQFNSDNPDRWNTWLKARRCDMLTIINTNENQLLWNPFSRQLERVYN